MTWLDPLWCLVTGLFLYPEIEGNPSGVRRIQAFCSRLPTPRRIGSEACLLLLIHSVVLKAEWKVSPASLQLASKLRFRCISATLLF